MKRAPGRTETGTSAPDLTRKRQELEALATRAMAAYFNAHGPAEQELAAQKWRQAEQRLRDAEEAERLERSIRGAK